VIAPRGTQRSSHVIPSTLLQARCAGHGHLAPGKMRRARVNANVRMGERCVAHMTPCRANCTPHSALRTPCSPCSALYSAMLCLDVRAVRSMWP
jgi:hypothetical protein